MCGSCAVPGLLGCRLFLSPRADGAKCENVMLCLDHDVCNCQPGHFHGDPCHLTFMNVSKGVLADLLFYVYYEALDSRGHTVAVMGQD